MALNDAAVDAAIDIYLNGFDPPMTEDQKTASRPGLRPLFRAIVGCVRDNAVVSPAGSPAMAVGGTAVTGTGKLT